MKNDVIDVLEEVRSKERDGQSVDLESYQARLGDDWAQFRDLYAFHESFVDMLESGLDVETPRQIGSYELVREIGRGAMGVVYEAHDAKLHRRVALKTLRPDLVAGPRTAQRYEREALSCAKVRHPNLIEIYDVGEFEGRPYYVMPLLTGGTLSDALEQDALGSPMSLCDRMADVANAVHELHQAQIVHRDIKPANIVVEEDGRFVLADFGLARRIDLPPLTRADQTVGTPHFMAPEQLENSPNEVDARTDVYALGATLYQALANRLPFEAPKLESLYFQILQKRPEDLATANPDVPRDVARIVMRCLEKRPEDRFATARELERNLRAVVAGKPVTGGVSPIRRALRTVRPWMVAAALVVAGLGMWWSSRDASPPPGQVRPPPMTLDLREATDEDLVRFIGAARKAGLTKLIFEIEDASHRNAANDPLQLVLPRGAVRIEDLDVLRVDVTDAFDGQGALVIRRGDDVLAELPFAGEDYRNEVAIPQSVRDAVQPGDELTWTFEPKRGRARRAATVRIVAPDLRDALARVDQQAAVNGQPQAVIPLLRALVHLEHDLGTAAFRAIEALPSGADPKNGSLPAVRLQIEALKRAFGDNVRALQATGAWSQRLLRLEDLGVR